MYSIFYIFLSKVSYFSFSLFLITLLFPLFFFLISSICLLLFRVHFHAPTISSPFSSSSSFSSPFDLTFLYFPFANIILSSFVYLFFFSCFSGFSPPFLLYNLLLFIFIFFHSSFPLVPNILFLSLFPLFIFLLLLLFLFFLFYIIYERERERERERESERVRERERERESESERASGRVGERAREGGRGGVCGGRGEFQGSVW